MDQHGHSGLIRRPDGRVEQASDIDLPLVDRLRSSLPALNAAA